jgi:hypothetical protein
VDSNASGELQASYRHDENSRATVKQSIAQKDSNRRSGLNARHDDERFGRIIEPEVFVLSQEREVRLDKPVSDTPIGGASLPKRDDVLRVLAFRCEPSVQRKGEVLIQENLQDAWRTAGGTCAATWAA